MKPKDLFEPNIDFNEDDDFNNVGFSESMQAIS